VQAFGIEILPRRRKGYAIKSLAQVLQTVAVRRKLSLGQEIKMEIPVHSTRLMFPSAISALEEGYRVQAVCDACGSANQIAEEMA
jgi:hypothetical protein